jgi:ataxia telangiectasia mutated family protein
MFTTGYDSHIEAVFEGIASRMNLPGRSDLIMIYASQIASSIAKMGPEFDLFRINPSVIGFRDRKALAKATFRIFAPVNSRWSDSHNDNISGWKRLANHCLAAGMTVADGVREAFPDIIAYELVWSFSYAPEQVEQRTRRCLGEWADELLSPDNLRRQLDVIFVATIRMLGEQDVTYDCSIVNLFRTRYKKEQLFRATFRNLTAYRALPGVPRTYQPNSPAEPASVILDALEWIKKRVSPDAVTAATSYHVFRQLSASIHNSPLVNEQFRLINALYFWISLHYTHFQEPMLIQALIQSSSLLLAQYDIARAAQGLLGWAFMQFDKDDFKPRFADARIADVLLRMASIQTSLSASDDSSESKLGHDLILFVEQIVIHLLKRPFTREQAVRALLAWPSEPRPELEELRRNSSIQTLRDILEDPRTVVNKFRVVRRLRDSSRSGDYPAERFSRVDFWRLKEYIPPRRQLVLEDADAFAALLFAHSGRIYGFGTDPLSSQTGRHLESRVRKEATGSPDPHEIEQPERILLEHLLCILDSSEPLRVQSAYDVLRCASSTKLPKLSDWAPDYALEMGYFSACPRPAITRLPFDLRTLNSLVDIAQDFCKWVSSLASAICDTIGQQRPFFSQLPPVLHSDPDFAGRVLPLLVHTLLRLRADGIATDEDPPIRTLLSQYFTTILSSTTSNVLCTRTIVNIVLHLRHFFPTTSKNDFLAYDKWLDIDYMLLSKSAIRCGAYTTALLFHELAFEYSREVVSPIDAEGILFDIYSHIDEPDGFYGIQTHDFHRFLIKRFHHEQQWDKAFMFHGAALEAQSQDPSEAKGLLHSLHSFGFDNLALSIQGSDSRNVTGSADMSYDLGWRTQTWDLPEHSSAEPAAGEALYRALRAVHRERDPANVNAVVKGALADVMDRVRTLGDEDLMGIRGAAQDLLCLSQIRQWQDSGFQDDITKKRFGTQNWGTFTKISQDFE